MARGVTSDAPALGGHDLARAAYDHRYMAACRIYLAEQHPRARASIVVDHTDPDAPVVSSQH
jgi:uridine kinase